MATIKINSVNKRLVNVNVTWSDGLTKSGLNIPDCPVESFADTYAYLYAYISGIYQSERAAADALIYNNPTIDPQVLAAVGKTFNDDGSIGG